MCTASCYFQQGKHAFKFIVDDEWRFAPDQPTVADIEGRINNFIDVSDFVAYTGDDNYLSTHGDRQRASCYCHTSALPAFTLFACSNLQRGK